MDVLKEDPILTFRSDTLQTIRKMYNLDSPARLEEAINIFDEWIKKQSHFTTKEFDKDFLERFIIANKGQLERAKRKLDKICTLRTLLPDFFSINCVKEDLKPEQAMQLVMLPKQTEDLYRVMIVKHVTKHITSAMILNYYKELVVLWEYILKHDYSTGVVIVFDYFNTNLMDLVTHVDMTELRQVAVLFTQGYSMRMKGIHLISTSKYTEVLVSLFKQVLSAKVCQRIKVHSTAETLCEFIPKNIMPVDYGGEEVSVSELNDRWIELLSAKEHTEYLKKTHEARTDEAHRSVDIFNEQHFGTPGSFRTLNVD